MGHQIQLQRLLGKVERVRKYQRQYFATKSKTDLQYSKNYESELDSFIAVLKKQGVTPVLDDQIPNKLF